ncbi:hypothetical protein ACU6T4_11615 [Avibacterium paragallinarum]|uniref:hypothetical protein n=1 Tax=Avibacterium paragallinarum TaxID=728 RepID=UPI000614BAA2|nr:hypothetical protein [Avibacterium paragallinarum]QIR10891.1 hypothetical protein HBL79_00640 [Avibacterium paragallinarum]QJE16854.1 hypothetical protein HHJ59_08175 [Avibacterium paragallinarum]QLD64002.1 hypothetical protein VY92_000755 [Avibacterium paragallinarum]TID11742.1 hypothetical protein JO83_12975 [Avibacterium paragallinarum]
MTLRQRFKDTFKFRNPKQASPFTGSTLKREAARTASRDSETVWAINRFDIPARGFFKRCTPFKDKLFRLTITRYVILKCGAFFFIFGQFFLSRFVSISEYFNLILEQRNTLTQDSVTLKTREQIKRGFDRSENRGHIHSKSTRCENALDCKKKVNFKQ